MRLRYSPCQAHAPKQVRAKLVLKIKFKHFLRLLKWLMEPKNSGVLHGLYFDIKQTKTGKFTNK